MRTMLNYHRREIAPPRALIYDSEQFPTVVRRKAQHHPMMNVLRIETIDCAESKAAIVLPRKMFIRSHSSRSASLS